MRRIKVLGAKIRQISWDVIPKLNFVTIVDLRVSGTLIRHILRFDIPIPQSTESNLRNRDKAQLRADILAMRAQGMSYRQIGAARGIHWTRVQQIVKSMAADPRGSPGWPDLALCTISTAKKRSMFTQR